MLTKYQYKYTQFKACSQQLHLELYLVPVLKPSSKYFTPFVKHHGFSMSYMKVIRELKRESNPLHYLVKSHSKCCKCLSLSLLSTDSVTKPNTFPDSTLFEVTDPPYDSLLPSDSLFFNSLCMSSKCQPKVSSFLFLRMS